MTDRLNPEALEAATKALDPQIGRLAERFPDSLSLKADMERLRTEARAAVSAYLAALPAPRTITTVEEIPATIQVISWEEEPEHECWKLSPDETLVGLIVKSGRSWSPADQYTLRVERTPTEGGGE